MNRRDLPIPGSTPPKKKRPRKKAKRKRKPKKWVSKRTESAILKDCLHWLQANGVFAWRNNTGALPTGNGRWLRYGYVGSADILGYCRNGRGLAIECKSPGGSQSPAQVEFQRRAEETNALYVLAFGAIDLETFRKEITK